VLISDIEMKKPASARAFSFAHAALLVLPAAAAGAGIVTTDSWMRLRTRGRVRGLTESGEFSDKRPAMGEEAFVPGTQIIQPIFTIGCS
jgi:hypothetical protein